MKHRDPLFCLLFLNSLIGTVFAACPYIDGNDGYCYKTVTNAATHDDAKSDCTDGFHLPKASNAATNDKIKELAQVLNSDAWLGASCSDNDICVWDDGTDMTLDFWLGHNPNVVNGKCVALTLADGTGRWQSVSCDDAKKSVICQKANSDVTTTTTIVPDVSTSTPAPIGLTCENTGGYTDGSDENCYKDVASALIFIDAKTRCDNEEGHLPKVLNKITNEELRKLASDLKAQIWLGLTCKADGTCTWNDGTALTFTNWINGKPDITEGYCATMKLSGSNAGLWESADCNFDKGVICQRDATVITVATPEPSKNCPAGFSLQKDNRCYLQYANGQGAKFDDAVATCNSHGALLAIIENDQQNLIYQSLMSTFGDRSLSAYLGLTYNPQTQNYHWVDGSSMTYSNFKETVPSLGNCVEIFVSGQNAPKWLNADCETVLPFACVTQSSLTPVSTVAPPFTCSYEYTVFETVKSPNYPHPYPENVECDSLLVVDNYYVRVTFETFSLKLGDYIDIFDGPHSGYPLLYRVEAASTVVNASFVTASSNKMLMRFVSKAGPSLSTGFMAYFQEWIDPYTGPTLSPAQSITTALPWIPGTVPPSNPALCPVPNVFKTSGIIATPGYPQPYGTSLHCLYILQADTSNDTISITFSPIDIDYNFDFLNLYDGNSTSSIRLASLAPTNKTSTYVSTKQYLLVELLTNGAYQHTGFVASFTSISSSHTISPSPTLVSDCQYGWHKDEDFPFCYKYHSICMTWDQAESTCQRDGADLVSIGRALQQLQIYKYINESQVGEKPYPVFIGFHRTAKNTWEWVDGDPVMNPLWLPGEPSNSDCAAIQMNTATTGAGWIAHDCNQPLPFICYYEIRTPLPPK